MFKKLWGWAKKNAGALIGGLLGGPIGAFVGALVDEYIGSSQEKSSGLPSHLQQEVDDFADVHVKPIVVEYFQSMGAASSPNDLVKTIHVNKLNTAIKKLATLKAYFEFIQKDATSGDQVLIYSEIISGLGQSIQIITETYQKATQGIANTHSPAMISFTPSSFDSIGNFQLNWQGTTVKGSYLGYKEASAGSNDRPGAGTVIQIPPPTGTKPRGSTGTTKPGGSTVGGQVATKPGGSTGGTQVITQPGGATNNVPVNNYKPLPAEITDGKKDNKKYWILGGAVLLAAYIFNQK